MVNSLVLNKALNSFKQQNEALKRITNLNTLSDGWRCYCIIKCRSQSVSSMQIQDKVHCFPGEVGGACRISIYNNFHIESFRFFYVSMKINKFINLCRTDGCVVEPSGTFLLYVCVQCCYFSIFIMFWMNRKDSSHHNTTVFICVFFLNQVRGPQQETSENERQGSITHNNWTRNITMTQRVVRFHL